MNILLQIGEFSKICQVSVKTLHHYDKIGLLAPAEVDRFTGYRYYKLEQIDTMNYIQRLKRYGFSLEEIQQIINLSDIIPKKILSPTSAVTFEYKGLPYKSWG